MMKLNDIIEEIQKIQSKEKKEVQMMLLKETKDPIKPSTEYFTALETMPKKSSSS